MLVRGAEPMEKRQRRFLFSSFPNLIATSLLLYFWAGNARRSLTSERSDQVKRGGVISSTPAFSLTPYSYIFHLPGVSLDIDNYCTVSLFFEQTYL